MIITINPVTVNDITTDKAILNMSLGDASVAMSLYPAVEVDGAWVRIEGAEVIPVVGLHPELLESVNPVVQAFITNLGGLIGY